MGQCLYSAAYGVDDLNLIVFLDRGCGVFGFRDDLLVQGHGKIRCLNIQLMSQISKSLAFQDFTVFAVNGKFQRNLSRKGTRFGPQ